MNQYYAIGLLILAICLLYILIKRTSIQKKRREAVSFYISTWGKTKSLDNFYNYDNISLLSKYFE